MAIGIWSLRWKSGCVHWDLEYKEAAGEEAQKPEEGEENNLFFIAMGHQQHPVGGAKKRGQFAKVRTILFCFVPSQKVFVKYISPRLPLGSYGAVAKCVQEETSVVAGAHPTNLKDSSDNGLAHLISVLCQGGLHPM